jgi:hypothetical protein
MTSLNIQWPGSNVALKKVESSGVEIWSGEDSASPTSFSCIGNQCRVNHNNNKVLVFFFDSDAAGGGYTLRVIFNNGCVVQESY